MRPVLSDANRLTDALLDGSGGVSSSVLTVLGLAGAIGVLCSFIGFACKFHGFSGTIGGTFLCFSVFLIARASGTGELPSFKESRGFSLLVDLAL